MAVKELRQQRHEVRQQLFGSGILHNPKISEPVKEAARKDYKQNAANLIVEEMQIKLKRGEQLSKKELAIRERFRKAYLTGQISRDPFDFEAEKVTSRIATVRRP